MIEKTFFASDKYALLKIMDDIFNKRGRDGHCNTPQSTIEQLQKYFKQ